MTISPPSGVGAGPAALTDEELQNFVASPLAGCAGTTLDPDEWFPIAAKPARARAEAARALTGSAACPPSPGPLTRTERAGLPGPPNLAWIHDREER